MFFHDEESQTIEPLLKYEDENPSSRLLMRFAEGDEYICIFLTAYEDENEDEDPKDCDEFQTIVYDVTDVIKKGPNLDATEAPRLLLNYKHFPVLVTTPTGNIVYKA